MRIVWTQKNPLQQPLIPDLSPIVNTCSEEAQFQDLQHFPQSNVEDRTGLPNRTGFSRHCPLCPHLFKCDFFWFPVAPRLQLNSTASQRLRPSTAYDEFSQLTPSRNAAGRLTQIHVYITRSSFFPVQGTTTKTSFGTSKKEQYSTTCGSPFHLKIRHSPESTLQ